MPMSKRAQSREIFRFSGVGPMQGREGRIPSIRRPVARYQQGAVIERIAQPSRLPASLVDEKITAGHQSAESPQLISRRNDFTKGFISVVAHSSNQSYC